MAVNDTLSSPDGPSAGAHQSGVNPLFWVWGILREWPGRRTLDGNHQLREDWILGRIQIDDMHDFGYIMNTV
eukprot:6444386-Pyramimonas_sp.AAC.1